MGHLLFFSVVMPSRSQAPPLEFRLAGFKTSSIQSIQTYFAKVLATGLITWE